VRFRASGTAPVAPWPARRHRVPANMAGSGNGAGEAARRVSRGPISVKTFSIRLRGMKAERRIATSPGAAHSQDISINPIVNKEFLIAILLFVFFTEPASGGTNFLNYPARQRAIFEPETARPVIYAGRRPSSAGISAKARSASFRWVQPLTPRNSASTCSRKSGSFDPIRPPSRRTAVGHSI
jgi:hypothetical protein